MSKYSYDIGSTYNLNCGVEVKVVAVASSNCVTVADSNGNQRTITGAQLRSGSVSWKRFGVGSFYGRSRPISAGDKYVLKCGVEVEVVRYIDSTSVIVKDSAGNTSSLVASEIRRGSAGWVGTERAWDYLKPTPGRSYVYCAKHGDRVLYIGRGKGNRYLHPTSGTSHKLELNRLYFSGETVEVSLLAEDLSDEEAAKEEVNWIKKLKPSLNVANNAKVRKL